MFVEHVPLLSMDGSGELVVACAKVAMCAHARVCVCVCVQARVLCTCLRACMCLCLCMCVFRSLCVCAQKNDLFLESLVHFEPWLTQLQESSLFWL